MDSDTCSLGPPELNVSFKASVRGRAWYSPSSTVEHTVVRYASYMTVVIFVVEPTLAD